MKRHCTLWGLAVLAWACALAPPPASALELERSVIGAGYSWGMSGETWLTGTAGQPVVDGGAAGSLELSSGFWPGYGGFQGQLAVTIEVPLMVHPGEAFRVTGRIMNLGPPRTGVPVFFILDVYGELWFWPSWAHYAPPGSTAVDYELRDIHTGYVDIGVVPEFTWPDTGTDSAIGLYFYGACLTPDMTAIDGIWSAVEWGFGPL